MTFCAHIFTFIAHCPTRLRRFLTCGITLRLFRDSDFLFGVPVRPDSQEVGEGNFQTRIRAKTESESETEDTT